MSPRRSMRSPLSRSGPHVRCSVYEFSTRITTNGFETRKIRSRVRIPSTPLSFAENHHILAIARRLSVLDTTCIRLQKLNRLSCLTGVFVLFTERGKRLRPRGCGRQPVVRLPQGSSEKRWKMQKEELRGTAYRDRQAVFCYGCVDCVDIRPGRAVAYRLYTRRIEGSGSDRATICQALTGVC